jgi:hypothetical protein
MSASDRILIPYQKHRRAVGARLLLEIAARI